MPSPVKMIHLQNITMVFASGHSVRFEKRQPVVVPAICVREAMARGAAPADEADLPRVEEEIAVKTNGPTGDARRDKIVEAMRMLRDANDPESFDANSRPKVGALKDLLGFRVDGAERDALWTELRASENGDA